MKKGCIFVNGNINDLDFYKSEAINYDIIISADGASDKLHKIGIQPNYIVGDLDSISPDIYNYYKNKNVIFKKYPKKKNKTDAEIAIDLAIELEFKEITLYGFIGSRLDHLLGNIYLVYYAHNKGIKLILKDNNNVAWLIDNRSCIINNNKGKTISFINLESNGVIISLSGFEYPLIDYNLELGSTRCISNIINEEQAIIELKEGKLLAIITDGLL